jgi:O-antigen/teichoic acid export membrane protein
MTCLNKVDSPQSLSLRGRLRFLLRDSLLYGGATAISRSFALITFPILARHFSVAEYGQLDFFMVLANLLALVVIFGQDSAIARFFYEDEETEARRQIVSQSLILQIAGCFFIVPFLWMTQDWVSLWLVQHEQSLVFYQIILLQLPFLVLINFSVNLLKFSFARVRFIVMSLGYTIFQATALVIAILLFKAGIREVLLICVASCILFSLLGLYFVRHWLIWPTQFDRVGEMLRFAIPFGVICVAGAFLPTLERSMTETYLGSEQLGLYSVGVKIAALMGLLITAFQTAWAPFSLSLFKQSDAAVTYNWVLKIFALVACATSFLLAISGGFLIHFLATERYASSALLVFPLAIGLAIQGTSWITEIGITISKRSELGLVGYACMIGVTFTMILVLAPRLGLWGVALAVMLGHCSKAVIASFLAQRIHPLSWKYPPVLCLFGFSVTVGCLGTFVGHYYSLKLANGIYTCGLISVLILGTFLLFSVADRNKMILSFGNLVRNYRGQFK